MHRAPVRRWEAIYGWVLFFPASLHPSTWDWKGLVLFQAVSLTAAFQLSPICKDQQDSVGLGKEVVLLLPGIHVAPLDLMKNSHSNLMWLYLEKASCFLITAFVMQA